MSTTNEIIRPANSNQNLTPISPSASSSEPLQDDCTPLDLFKRAMKQGQEGVATCQDLLQRGQIDIINYAPDLLIEAVCTREGVLFIDLILNTIQGSPNAPSPEKRAYYHALHQAALKEGEELLDAVKALQSSPFFEPDDIFNIATTGIQGEGGIPLCTWLLENDLVSAVMIGIFFFQPPQFEISPLFSDLISRKTSASKLQKAHESALFLACDLVPTRISAMLSENFHHGSIDTLNRAITLLNPNSELYVQARNQIDRHIQALHSQAYHEFIAAMDQGDEGFTRCKQLLESGRIQYQDIPKLIVEIWRSGEGKTRFLELFHNLSRFEYESAIKIAFQEGLDLPGIFNHTQQTFSLEHVFHMLNCIEWQCPAETWFQCFLIIIQSPSFQNEKSETSTKLVHQGICIPALRFLMEHTPITSLTSSFEQVWKHYKMTALDHILLREFKTLLQDPDLLAKMDDEKILACIDLFIEKMVESAGKVMDNTLFHLPTQNPKMQIVRSRLNQYSGMPTPSIENDTFDMHDLLFGTCPSGLPIFEKYCQQHASQLSLHGLRWIFVKASTAGEQGKSLMHLLITQHGEKLSSITYSRAIELAEKRGDLKIAQWIKEHQGQETSHAASSSTQTSAAADLDDLILLLRTTIDGFESGYRTLGDIPIKAGWQPLNQADLNRLRPADYELKAENPFEGSDIVIIEDEIDRPLALNEIYKNEADLFSDLYQLIRDGHTPLKMDEKTKEFTLEQIKQLLTRPSGRWAMLFACRMSCDLPICKSNSAQSAYIIVSDNPWIRKGLHLSFDPAIGPVSRINETGQYLHAMEPLPLDSIFFHELLHALHDDYNHIPFKQLTLTNPHNKMLTNLEELYTTTGIDTQIPEFRSLAFFGLCDNTYRFEKGYPGRSAHAMTEEELRASNLSSDSSSSCVLA